MLTLAGAIFLASLLGSMHCVGMCGPLALWATGGGRSRTSVVAYHLGRLTTYLSAGLAAGVLGTALTIGGNAAGLQSLAATLAGGLLVEGLPGVVAAAGVLLDEDLALVALGVGRRLAPISHRG